MEELKSEKCTVCGISRLNGTFIFSHNNKPTTPNQVKTRICQYTKRPGCINEVGEIVPELGYMPPNNLNFKVDDTDINA